MSASIREIPRQIDAALRSPWQMRALTIIASMIVNAVILTVGRIATGELPAATVGGDDQTIGYGQVVLVTALVGLAGWGLLALLERVTPRARSIWTLAAIATFALSLLGPLGSGVDTASTLVLASMHVGAAATIIPLMRRSIEARDGAQPAG